jgi:hypothetical protein
VLPAELLDVNDVPEGFTVVSSFVFIGQGYLGLDSAAAAVRSATAARTRSPSGRSLHLRGRTRRKQLRPVLTGGRHVMDTVFSPQKSRSEK